MKSSQPWDEAITDKEVFEQRRQIIKLAAAGAFGAGMSAFFGRAAFANTKNLSARTNTNFVATDERTSYKDATAYNNFYEFGVGKTDPATYAHTLQTSPWSLEVSGLVKKPLKLSIDTLLKLTPLEERVYRLRCVEGWSMVIPWIGYSLSSLIALAEPTSEARFVEFTSLADAKQMPGLAYRVLNWPYVEGLRLDEALHPLTLLTFGCYGEVLPKQNGAPLRIIVPWKYGFKSAKSLVRIRLTHEQPKTSWNAAAPDEYGFYSNVNPSVPHPRWSQATERRISGTSANKIFAPRIKTLPFNGYAEQVASLYQDMDLRKYF